VHHLSEEILEDLLLKELVSRHKEENHLLIEEDRHHNEECRLTEEEVRHHPEEILENKCLRTVEEVRLIEEQINLLLLSEDIWISSSFLMRREIRSSDLYLYMN
jgi:hypothetical protein